MDLGQRATSVKFLIRDRVGQFTSSLGTVFTADARANAICERDIGTLRPPRPVNRFSEPYRLLIHLILHCG